jgi:peptide/nickel transport system permease protein
VTTIRASRSAEARGHAASFARLAGTVAITLVGLAALTFFIGRVMPIDPVIALIGEQADQQTYKAVYAQLGLDKPLPVQFLYYLRDIATGNFGVAISTGHPVIEDI